MAFSPSLSWLSIFHVSPWEAAHVMTTGRKQTCKEKARTHKKTTSGPAKTRRFQVEIEIRLAAMLIKVILINLSNETHTIEVGDKIAQAVLTPVMSGKYVNLQRVLNVDDKDRGDNGFGSTGN